MSRIIPHKRVQDGFAFPLVDTETLPWWSCARVLETRIVLYELLPVKQSLARINYSENDMNAEIKQIEGQKRGNASLSCRDKTSQEQMGLCHQNGPVQYDHSLQGTSSRCRPHATVRNWYTCKCAPVAKYTNLRFILAFATRINLEILELDVEEAFLNEKLEDTVYVAKSETFINPEKRSWLYLLLKALHGLKKASSAWHKLIRRILLS